MASERYPSVPEKIILYLRSENFRDHDGRKKNDLGTS